MKIFLFIPITTCNKFENNAKEFFRSLCTIYANSSASDEVNNEEEKSKIKDEPRREIYNEDE